MTLSEETVSLCLYSIAGALSLRGVKGSDESLYL